MNDWKNVDNRKIFEIMNENGTMNYLNAKELYLTVKLLIASKSRIIHNGILLTDANTYRKESYMLAHELVATFLRNNHLKYSLNSMNEEYPEIYPMIPKKSMYNIKLKLNDTVFPLKELIGFKKNKNVNKQKQIPQYAMTNVSDSDPGLDLSD